MDIRRNDSLLGVRSSAKATGTTPGNYRDYDVAHVEQLAFMRHCRTLDMTLVEIRVLFRA